MGRLKDLNKRETGIGLRIDFYKITYQIRVLNSIFKIRIKMPEQLMAII
jgi:hypothetical protein